MEEQDELSRALNPPDKLLLSSFSKGEDKTESLKVDVWKDDEVSTDTADISLSMSRVSSSVLSALAKPLRFILYLFSLLGLARPSPVGAHPSRASGMRGSEARSPLSPSMATATAATLSWWKDFQHFMIGNRIIEMGIAFVVGRSFNYLVKSFVNDLLVGPVGLLIVGTRR
jgi:hypothetical protein